jgi:membrane protein YqaA with SNARE-associated domain
MPVQALNLLAFLWGFAEATLFFIVPDVLLSLIALGSRRRALVAAAFTVAGALFGGWLMYRLAALDASHVRSLLLAIPAISPGLPEQVRQQLDSLGYASLFVGAFSGVPYKIYATEAGAAALPLAPFLALTIPARALRFLLVVAGVNWIARRWASGLSHARRAMLALGCWGVFYGWYFSVM